MKLIRTKETVDASIIISILECNLAYSDAPELSLRMTPDGFTLQNKEKPRYVICTVMKDDEGIMLELGTTPNEMKGIVMCKLKNSEITKAAENIFRWFTVVNGDLFDVPAHMGLAEHAVKRFNGTICRYKISGE